MNMRVLRHLLLPDWWLRRKFTASVQKQIQSAVIRAESMQAAEIRVAIEASLDLPFLLRGVTARGHALEIFSQLRVWDTEENNGVLLYVLLADRDVEIVADRGVAKRVSPARWQAICRDMENLFRHDKQVEAILLGVDRIGAILAECYPGTQASENQLPDQPAMLE